MQEFFITHFSDIWNYFLGIPERIYFYILKIIDSIPYFSPILKCSARVLGITLFFLVIRFVYFQVLRLIKKISCFKDCGNQRWLSGNQWFMIGVFISAFMLFLKVCEPSEGLFTKITQSVIDSMRLFTFELRLPELREMVFSRNNDLLDVKSSGFELVFSSAKDLLTTENGCWLSNLYLSFMALLAPACTVVAAVSLFLNDLFVQLKYILPFRKVFVLSELNEKSLCLAKDIRKNHPLSLIIFTSVRKNDAENDFDDLLSQVKEINAKTTKKSVTGFHFLLHKTPHIYLIDKEEKDNVKNGKSLFKKYRKKNIIINVFSTLKSAETFINDIDKEDARAEINLIDPAQIIAYSLLMEKPMFEAADACGSDTMSVLVVGAGYVGMECAKAAMWCGVMDSLKFKIRIIDKEDREKEFDSEIVGFRNNLKRVGLDFDYNFYQADVNDKWFIRLLETCRDANYIIVGLGDDELTINTYKKIRQFYLRQAVDSGNYSLEKMPVIIPIIRSKAYKELIKKGEKEKFYSTGCNADIFREKFIDEWAVEKFAEKINKHYNNSDDQSKKKTERNKYKSIEQTKIRSSRASAVHSVYKLRDMGIRLELIEKGIENDGLTKEDLDSYLHSPENISRYEALTATEHNRWCVFQLLDGWTGISLDDIKKVNNVRIIENEKEKHKFIDAGMHATIVKNDELEKVGLELYNNKDKFIENNKKVIEFLGSEMIDAMKEAYNKDVKIYINEGENYELHSKSYRHK